MKNLSVLVMLCALFVMSCQQNNNNDDDDNQSDQPPQFLPLDAR